MPCVAVAKSIDPDLSPISQVRQLMTILRGPDGCEWDRAQTHADIAPYTVEEAYEVMDAVEREDIADLRAELGDLLFQTVFQSRIAEEAGTFDFDDVCRELVEKMVRRHPHVFSNAKSADWDALKASERGGSALSGVALALPALMRAQKLQKRAARTGFDWPSIGPVADKVREELDELADATSEPAKHEELGDLLFSVVNLARHHGVDSEAALRDANAKFERRFAHVEAALGDTLPDASLDEMEAEWIAAKRLGL